MWTRSSALPTVLEHLEDKVCLSAAPAVTIDGLVSWYMAEGDAADSAGDNEGSLVNSELTVSNGLVGRAFSNNGTIGNHVHIPTSPSLESPVFTTDAWVFANSAGSHPDADGPIILTKDPVGTDPFHAFGMLGPNNAGQFEFILGFNNGARAVVRTTRTFAFGQWHHVAMSWDGTTMRGFVDGQEQFAQVIGATSVFFNPTAPWSIGSHTASGTRAYDGQIDEVGIYDRALSGAEIEAIYSSGSHGRYSVTVGHAFSRTGKFEDADSSSWTATVDYGDGSGVQPLSLNPDRTFDLNHVYSAPGTFPITVQVTDDGGNTTSRSVPVNVIPDQAPRVKIDGLVSWYMGEGDASDSAGDNEGSLVNGEFTVSNGLVGGAFSNNGTIGNFVYIPASPSLSPQVFTTDAWVFANSAGSHPDSEGAIILSRDPLPGDPFHSFAVLGPNNAGQFEFILAFIDNQRLVIRTTNTFDFREWHHVAMSWDGTTLRGYVDGNQEISAVVGPNTVYWNTAAPWSIGAHSFSGTRAFDGMIDEVGIYDRALSSSEINTLWEHGNRGRYSESEGLPFQLAGTFTDIDSLQWIANVDYGDGTGSQTLLLNSDHSFLVSHVYSSPGRFVINVTITDEAGTSAEAAVPVVVVPSIPTVAVVEPSDRGRLISGGPDTNDTAQIVVSLSEALTPAVELAFDAYQAHLDAGLQNTPFTLAPLNITLVGFEHFGRLLSYGSFRGIYDNPIAGSNYSETLTGTVGRDLIAGNGGNDTIFGLGGADIIIGASGDDSIDGGDDDDTYLYSGAANGFDTLIAGAGYDKAIAVSAGTVIGLNGYANGVEEFVGLGDTIVRDTAYSKTLDFSNTILTGIAEIDAAGGNDVVTASNLSSGVYRGGAGDDVLNAGSMAVTWKYSGTSNGFDTLNNGSGTTLAFVESAGTVIGVNGYINGVDEFVGLSDTIIRDTAYSKTLDFSNTVLTGIAEVDAAGGNDVVTASNLSPGVYRGGAGDDILNAGSTAVTWRYSGAGNGFDTLNNGSGTTLAVVESAGTVIGVNGYVNGVDEFVGLGDTIIRDTAYSKTLDFSNTILTGIAEIDAAGGNDVVTASNLSPGVYRGGSGDDVLNAGSMAVTWKYSGNSNGFDTLNNGSGTTLAVVESAGTVIGVNGYVNGVDEFVGLGDTIIRDTAYSKTLDFSNTVLTGIAAIDAAGGNDVVTASNLSPGVYRGGAGDDVLNAGSTAVTWKYSGAGNGFDTLNNGSGTTLAVVESAGTVIGVNGYVNGVDEFVGLGDTIIRDTAYSKTLDFSNTVLTGIAEVDTAGGNDVVTASRFSSTLYRLGTGDDTLVILNTTLAQVRVADFKQSGRDRIDLRTFGISNRLAGLTRTQSGADTLVSGPPNLNLRLLDTLFGSLVDADFLF
ncbi:MAG: LamG-like jellyroll fold domain-containing protein [Planctomycetaceae bacterium]